MDDCNTYRLGRWVIQDKSHYNTSYAGLKASFWLMKNCNKFDNLKDLKEGLMNRLPHTFKGRVVIKTSKISSDGVDIIAETLIYEEEVTSFTEEVLSMEVEATPTIIVYEA